MIEYRYFITRKMLRTEVDKIFVFGDNCERKGMGGQAREMRGETNALGIVTKFGPGTYDADYLSDDRYSEWFNVFIDDVKRLKAAFDMGMYVVFPADGIGTGLAEVKDRAPECWRTLTDTLTEFGIENPHRIRHQAKVE